MESKQFEIIQGNSEWVKFTCKRFDEIDANWNNFTGTWGIFDTAGLSVASGNLSRVAGTSTTGYMYARITSVQTSILDVGVTYTLASQIVNTAAEYVDERQDFLIVAAASLLA